MSNATLYSKTDDQRGSLLSHSTILILSGFLIGMASSNITQPGSQFYVYCIGLFGIVSYFALGHVAKSRHEKSAQMAADKAASRMEGRLDRHVSNDLEIRSSHAASRKTNHGSQYMTVTKSHGRFEN